MKQLRPCRRCLARPAKNQNGSYYCYVCNPGPSGAPPCRKCGSTTDYFTSGLCARCHRFSPKRLDSCLDCLAWGALRRDKWLCQGCLGWHRAGRPVGACTGCHRQVPLDGEGICRLCRRQLLTLPAEQRSDLAAALRHGQQLFLAGMFRDAANRRVRAARPPRPTPPPVPARARRRPPVQLSAFDIAVPARTRPAPRPCKGCGERPVRSAAHRYCHACAPNGPHTPPPCRKCGSSTDYYTAGMCVRCHRHSPIGTDSCTDCLGWGTGRTTNWLCEGCRGWRRRHPRVASCRYCHRHVNLDERDTCRLCRKQASMQPPHADRDLAALTRFGQQLYFAEMFNGLGATKTAQAARRRQRRDRDTPPPVTSYRPATHVQLTAFAARRDYQALTIADVGDPREPLLARYLDEAVTDHAARHGWKPGVTQRARRGMRILLALQDTPGAALKASDVIGLSRIDVNVRCVLDVLTATGLLIDDRTPSALAWFTNTTDGLPEQMLTELKFWFDIQLLGSFTPPRSHPRQPRTAISRLRWALPALHALAAAGHHSLREVSRSDVLTALPPTGLARITTGHGLRSIFKVLKGHKKIFVDPTTRIRLEAVPSRVPLPAAISDIRAALNATDPLTAAVAALIAFHGLQAREVPAIKLTDLRDHRLHLAGRVIPLAEPVRERLDRWLDQRAARWPNTINDHLFIHQHCATGTTPGSADWLTRRMGMSAQQLREDRILHEAHATGGDIRRLCDLFGLSVSGAARYAATVDGSDLADRHAGQRVSSPTHAPP